jgi:hypothetical protein
MQNWSRAAGPSIGFGVIVLPMPAAKYAILPKSITGTTETLFVATEGLAAYYQRLARFRTLRR